MIGTPLPREFLVSVRVVIAPHPRGLFVPIRVVIASSPCPFLGPVLLAVDVFPYCEPSFVVYVVLPLVRGVFGFVLGSVFVLALGDWVLMSVAIRVLIEALFR